MNLSNEQKMNMLCLPSLLSIFLLWFHCHVFKSLCFVYVRKKLMVNSKQTLWHVPSEGIKNFMVSNNRQFFLCVWWWWATWSIYVLLLLDLFMVCLVYVCKHRGTIVFSRNHLGGLINLCVFLVNQVRKNRAQLVCMVFGLVKLGTTKPSWFVCLFGWLGS
jgi:hypothetical protein